MTLIDGEKIQFTDAVGANLALSDDEINKKYIDGEIRIVTEQARYPLDTIASMVDSANYVLDPEFQRRHRWNNERRSALIESLIMNVPIPPIFLYEYKFSGYEVMDGLQRLTAIASFYKDEYELVGLTKWPELNGKKYSELPDQVQRGIDRRYISSIILLHESAKTTEEADKMKQMVFDRINSGGEALSPQEKRNANFNGKLNKLCMKLSNNEFLCKMWDIPLPEFDGEGRILQPTEERKNNKLFRSMGDVELVLRFFAFRQRKELNKGLNLEQFLDKYLQYGNKFGGRTLETLETIFWDTVGLVYELFGDEAFWLYRVRKNGKWSWYERPTTTVYDAMMYIVSTQLHQKDVVLRHKQKFVDALPDFYQKNYEIFEGRNTNPSALDARENCFKDFFDTILVSA